MAEKQRKRIRWQGITGSGLIGLALPVLCILMAMFWLSSCSDDGTTVEFPPRPPQVSDLWFFSIWGNGANNVYVVGQPGIILHYNGTSWRKMDSPSDEPLTTVWGRPNGSEVFVCGHNGVILHNTGSGWSTMSSGTTENLYGIGRYQDGNIYACGQAGTLRRLQGGEWVNPDNTFVRRNPSGTTVIDTLERDDDIESLVVVHRYAFGGADGNLLMDDVPVPPSTVVWPWEMRLITGGQEWILSGWSSETIADNYVTTDGGKLFQLSINNETQRLSWSELPSPAFSPVYGIWREADGDLYFVSQDGDVSKRSSDGTIDYEFYLGDDVLYGIWGNGPNNIYAAGVRGTLLNYDGSAWTPVDLSGLDLSPLAQAKSDAGKFGRSLD